MNWTIKKKSKRTVNSITQDESSEKGDDPALRTLSTVFKSLFNGGNGSNITTVNPFPATSATTSTSSDGDNNNQLFDSTGMQKFLEMLANEIPPEVIAQFTTGAGTSESSQKSDMPTTSSSTSKKSALDSPMGVLKLIEPMLSERLVQEVNTTYEFHIKIESDPSTVEIYHLDLKTPPRGSIGKGPSVFSKADCAIKLSDRDLTDLLTDQLKPFTAYMSGRIEVDGNLQDVFRLKKLIKSATTILAKLKH